MVDIIDLTGGRYGRLAVIKLSDKRIPSSQYKRFWDCVCDCGNLKTVEGYWLTNGNIVSCGCKRKEHQQLGHNVRKSLDKDYTVDGVDVTKLASKQRKNTDTGHKGVYPYVNKSNPQGYLYTAALGFKGKLINLGSFISLKDAIAARKKAEDKYFKPYLDKHAELISCAAPDCNVRFMPSRKGQEYHLPNCRYRHHKQVLRQKRIYLGLCPQCGGEMIQGKSKHCDKCAKYYKGRYPPDA